MLRVRYVCVCAFALACAIRQEERADRVESGPSEEVFLREGESAPVLDGQVVVTLADVEPGNRIAEVTVRLATPDGQSTAGTVEVVRNQNYSEAMRLEPFAVRVVEYPGVDSARLVVTREPPGVAPD
ncbi:MAG TPA: hypothetical protein VFH11_09390 [Gemmatimonadota bacterium]|nr:hypothetical protein [Gemmatimonadota bacterium]